MTPFGIFRPCPPALECLKHKSSSAGHVNSFSKKSMRTRGVGVARLDVEFATGIINWAVASAMLERIETRMVVFMFGCLFGGLLDLIEGDTW